MPNDIYLHIDELIKQVLYLDNFDPYSYLINDSKVFMVKDLTGRGYTVKRKGSEIVDENQDNEDLINFIDSATFGDEYKTAEEKYTHI